MNDDRGNCFLCGGRIEYTPAEPGLANIQKYNVEFGIVMNDQTWKRHVEVVCSGFGMQGAYNFADAKVRTQYSIENKLIKPIHIFLIKIEALK